MISGCLFLSFLFSKLKDHENLDREKISINYWPLETLKVLRATEFSSHCILKLKEVIIHEFSLDDLLVSL